MDTSTIVWIIVIVLAVLILAAVLSMVMGKKRKEQHRTRAAELREQAAAQSTGVQQREAEHRETEARAQEARAQAERKQAEADRLEAAAQDKGSTASTYRDERDDSLRQADELDPDVKHDKHDPDAGRGRDSDRSTDTGGTGEGLEPEGQRYDADGNPIRRDGSPSDVDTDHRSHRA